MISLIVENPTDFTRFINLESDDLEWSAVVPPSELDTTASTLLWDELDNWSYLDSIIKFNNSGTGVKWVKIDFFEIGTRSGRETEGFAIPPKQIEASGFAILAHGFAKWQNGQNDYHKLGDAFILRNIDNTFTLYCKVPEAYELTGLDVDRLTIKIDYQSN